MEPADLAREAERRYLLDPEFHAEVDIAVRVCHVTVGPLDHEDRAFATLGAAVALLVRERHLAVLMAQHPAPVFVRLAEGELDVGLG
jgi:hypothetical protein